MILQGDCLLKLKELEDNSVDSIVTDPPYELGFMGKSWDNTGIANNKEMWAECLRVLKPGGHLLSFSGTRTYHRMACAIEDAGFEVRDMIEWVYGSGFPKSHNIGKNIEKIKVGGIKNLKQIGTKKGIKVETGTQGFSYSKEYVAGKSMGGKQISGDIPVYEINNEWEGWGTALKPSHEPICMARKPLDRWWKIKDDGKKVMGRVMTVAENCLKWGTGGINIDESRVETSDNLQAVVKGIRTEGWRKMEGRNDIETEKKLYGTPEGMGRFPANLIHDNSEEVRECFPETKSVKSQTTNERYLSGNNNTKQSGDGKLMYGKISPENTHNDSGNASRFFKAIENNDRMVWLGTPEEEEEYNNLIAEMQDDQVFTEEQDKRYEELSKKSLVNKYYKYPKINRRYYKSIIYQAKASKSERNSGCEGLEEKETKRYGDFEGTDEHAPKLNVKNTNNHPTVKPIALMEYLIKMVTPKGGIVLDPFAGSGSTLVAAKQNGYKYIGIELTPEYIPIIEARLNASIIQQKLL